MATFLFCYQYWQVFVATLGICALWEVYGYFIKLRNERKDMAENLSIEKGLAARRINPSNVILLDKE